MCFPLQLHHGITYYTVESQAVDNQRNNVKGWLVNWWKVHLCRYEIWYLLWSVAPASRSFRRMYIQWLGKLKFCNYFVSYRMEKVWVTESWDTVLEVFGDVVISLRVLQKLHQGIWGLFHQKRALCILWGQWTPHNLQVLCQNTKKEGGVDT